MKNNLNELLDWAKKNLNDLNIQLNSTHFFLWFKCSYIFGATKEVWHFWFLQFDVSTFQFDVLTCNYIFERIFNVPLIFHTLSRSRFFTFGIALPIQISNDTKKKQVGGTSFLFIKSFLIVPFQQIIWLHFIFKPTCIENHQSVVGWLVFFFNSIHRWIYISYTNEQHPETWL